MKGDVAEIEKTISTQKFTKISSENDIWMRRFVSPICRFSVLYFTLYVTLETIKEPTYYKNFDNPLCEDFILMNCPNHFQNSSFFKIGLSDFHKIIMTRFKS